MVARKIAKSKLKVYYAKKTARQKELIKMRIERSRSDDVPRSNPPPYLDVNTP